MVRDFPLGRYDAVFYKGASGFSFPLFLRTTIRCPLDFKAYPFDTHSCPFVLHPLDIDSIDFVWGSPPSLKRITGGNSDNPIDNWKRSLSYEDRLVNITPKIQQDPIHDVYYLKVEYTFERSSTAFAIQSMVPTFMLVIASYGSLYIPPSQIPGRMTLAITTCLTQIAMISSALDDSPPTSYLKVVDLVLLQYLSCILICYVFSFINTLQTSRAKPGGSLLMLPSFTD